MVIVTRSCVKYGCLFCVYKRPSTGHHLPPPKRVCERKKRERKGGGGSVFVIHKACHSHGPCFTSCSTSSEYTHKGFYSETSCRKVFTGDKIHLKTSGKKKKKVKILILAIFLKLAAGLCSNERLRQLTSLNKSVWEEEECFSVSLFVIIYKL